jgi:hypothetical protein
LVGPRTRIKTTNFLQEEFWKSLRAFEEQRDEFPDLAAFDFTL